MATKRYKRDFKALERRRKKAAQLLTKGMKQADVARALGVSRQSVSAWAKAQEIDEQAWRRKPLGSQPGLGQAQRHWLCKLLVRGAQANGFATAVWTLRRMGQLIEREFGIAYGKTNVWLLLKQWDFPASVRPGVPASVMKRRSGNGGARAGQGFKKKPAEREESFSLSTRAA